MKPEERSVMRFAAVSGTTAVYTIYPFPEPRIYDGNPPVTPLTVVRVQEGGALEVTTAPDGVEDLVVGDGRDPPVAWLNQRRSKLYVWRKGKAPRPIALFSAGPLLEPPARGSIAVRHRDVS